MIKIFIFSTFVCLALTVFAGAQTATYKWQDEFCEYEGTFDQKRFSAKQIDATRELLFSSETMSLSLAETTIWKFEDIGKIDLVKLDKDYNAIKSRIETLEIVKTPYTERIRNERLRELEQTYQLTRATLRAYTSPRSWPTIPELRSVSKNMPGR